jgi:hypothetical protein
MRAGEIVCRLEVKLDSEERKRLNRLCRARKVNASTLVRDLVLEEEERTRCGED